MRALFVHAFIIGLVFTSIVFAQKRNITEKDLFDFTWIGDPQVSPDNSLVAIVRVTVNEKKDGYNTSIWGVPAGGGEPRRLTSGNHDSSPRWSPDGKYLAFVRVTEKEGKPDQTQLFMLAMSGGDSFQFTSVPRGAGQPVWSPDGNTIAFVSNSNPEDLSKQSKDTVAGDTKKPEANDRRESDVRIITQAVYRFNGAGYVDAKRPQHIWVIAAPRTSDDKVSPKQLTNGRFDEDDVIWASDSRQIYFTSVRSDEPYYELPKTEIYSVAVTGGEPVKLTSFNMGSGNFSISPNGKQLAFIASSNEPVRSYSEPDLWVIDLAPGAQPRNLTAGFDYDVGAGVGGDNAPPRASGGSNPIWSSDGREIIEVYAKEGKANLGRFDTASGKETDVTTGNQAVISFRSTPDRKRLIYSISTPTRVGDLFSIDRSGGQPTQLTRINDAVFSKLNLTEPEEVWYTSFDGRKIQAWLQKPPDFDPQKKYPMILNIHGGPHAAYGYVFDHEFQWMAAKGYLVLYPNPRGSTSYGQEFGNIIQYKYPGDDYKDLM